MCRIKLKILFTLIFWNLFFHFAKAQNIQGIVTDAKTGETLIGVTVQDNNGHGAQTDIEGKYDLKCNEGKSEITFSYIGYNTKKISVELKKGQTLFQDVSLSEEQKVLDQVVVTGSKFEKKLSEETVSIEVVRPNVIQNNNVTQVDQAVETVPGVTIIDGQANIRGGSGYSYGAGSRVLLMQDDMPILQADAGFPNWSFVAVENISQIEVIKGAASAMYGSSALNGIINIRTAYPTSKPYFNITGFHTITGNPAGNKYYRDRQVGANTVTDTFTKSWWGKQYPTTNGLSYAYRKKFGQFDLVMGGYAFGEDSYLQGIYDRRIRQNVYTRYRFKNVENLAVGCNFNFQIGESNSFFIWNASRTGSIFEQEYHPKGAYQPGFATPTTTKGLRFSIDPFLNYQDKFGNKHKLLTRWLNVDNKNSSNQDNYSDFYYGEYQFQRALEKIGLTVTSGIVANHVNVVAGLYGTSPDSAITSTNVAGYVQLDKKFFNKLTLTGGARYEWFKNSGKEEAKPVFRFGANYQAAEYTFVRASWGQGYRYPTIAERNIITNVGAIYIFPNRELRSETGWSSELGLKQGFKISSWKGFVDLSGFYTEYQDMMEFTFNVTNRGLGFQSINVGNTQIMGTEVTVAGIGKIGNVPLQVMSGYTYIDPKYKDWETPFKMPEGSIIDPNNPPTQKNTSSDTTNNILKYRFKHTFKMDFQATVKKFEFGATINYLSEMKNIDNVFQELLPGVKGYRDANKGKGIFYIDARIGYNPTEQINVAFIVKNALNNEYSVRPAMMESPINFTVKMSYTMN